ADLARETHSHGVPRFLDANTHRRQAEEFFRIVGRLVASLHTAFAQLAGDKGAIEYAIRGRPLVGARSRVLGLKSRGVNERLESGARLAPRLDRAIQLAALEGIAAGHSEHPT